jgi:hypothetical protein
LSQEKILIQFFHLSAICRIPGPYSSHENFLKSPSAMPCRPSQEVGKEGEERKEREEDV